MNGDISNGAKTPGSPKRSSAKGRMQVALLDDTVVAFDVEPRAKGEELYKKVNTHLNLEEAEFFGLLFGDEEENICWLDHLKPINKQVKDPTKVVFKFRVMFYTPDPNSLQEYTRYLFTLQVRRDLLDGRLHCSEDTGALLASYIVQGELNDYDPVVHKDGYLTGFQFVPQQTPEIEQKIVEYHKSHKGETPSEADHNMLEIARQLEMYGITLYAAQDSDNVPLHLAVYHLGVLVFQNKHKINNFSWANVRKISFKKKRLLIKLHRGIEGDAEVVMFGMKTRNAAKTFWKVCVNHHVFFRQASASTLKRNKAAFRRGSKYRYSGRTKKEISEDASVAVRSTSESDDKNRSQKASVLTPSTSSVPDSPLSDVPPKYHSRQVSEDEGSFSVSSEAHPTLYRDESTTELEDDNIVASPANHISQNIITMTHQDTVEAFGQPVPTREPLPPSYTEVMNNEVITYTVSQPVESAALEYDDEDFNSTLGNAKTEENDTPFNFTLTPLSDNINVEDDDLSLDATVNITSTDREIEAEVESMFKMINSEYSRKSPSWQYNISSVTREELKSDDEDNEHSDTEDKINTEVSESTEVDADEARKFDSTIVNNNNTHESDKTEADEETEAQLREKVKGLTYLELQPTIEVS